MSDDLGFVLLHRCGAEFYFLIVCTWRQANELWETVYYKQDAKMDRFALFPREEPHIPTFCVWELGVVAHEMQAWSRFLKSARDGAAAGAYLDDRFSGPV